jgi:hypothetical protein
MIVIIDGPPASGKSTLASFLAKKFNARIYSFKRLGFLNLSAELLFRIIPSVSMLSGKRVSRRAKVIQMLKRERKDPVLFIDTSFLQKMAFINLLLEVFYKYVRFFLLIVLVLMYRNIIVDEWFSLGWANYYNIAVYKKAFKPKYVKMLIRLDMQILYFLSKINKVFIFFIDRNQEKLTLFWRRRGHIILYDVKYAILARYFFNLFAYLCEKYKVSVNLKYLYLS